MRSSTVGLCYALNVLRRCHESTLPSGVVDLLRGSASHTCVPVHTFAVRGRCAPTLQEEELVCVATDEEAIKAYRAALQTALEGPSAAHPTEGFGDDNLSLSQARHRAVPQGLGAGKAAQRTQHSVSLVSSHGDCTQINAHRVAMLPFNGDPLSAGDQEQRMSGTAAGIT